MATAVKVDERLAPAEQSQAAITWRRFRKHRFGLFGFGMLAVLIMLVIVQPLFSAFDFGTIPCNEVRQFAPAGAPSACGPTHWLGTDDVGRDMLTRLFYAGRISLTVGMVSTILVVLLGTIVGALAGFYGGWVDTILMRFV